MASIRYYLRGKNNPVQISLRLSISNKQKFKRVTPLVIDSSKWSDDKPRPKKPKDAQTKKLVKQLDKLREFILESYNESIFAGEVVNGLWLDAKLNEFFNRRDDGDGIDYSILNNYIDYFINEKQKQYKKGQLTIGSLKKYKVVANRIREFQFNEKLTLRLVDINLENIDRFENYLLNTHGYSPNTTGRLIKFIKQIAIHARDYKGVIVSKELAQIKGYRVEAKKIYLSFDEIDKINKTKLDDTAESIARYWLVIGCYTGQRVSDLLRFEKSNIVNIKGSRLIQITQKKTGKLTSIPIHPKVENIIQKYEGEFPPKLSDINFNKHIKQVARKAGLTQKVQGALFNKETKRKEDGIFEKCDLISSHICRRSFATNFYGIIPTPLLISITAHSTEKQYLEYVGKPEQEKSLQVAEMWKNSITDDQPDTNSGQSSNYLKIV